MARLIRSTAFCVRQAGKRLAGNRCLLRSPGLAVEPKIVSCCGFVGPALLLDSRCLPVIEERVAFWPWSQRTLWLSLPAAVILSTSR
jgi:hypothetical protein